MENRSDNNSTRMTIPGTFGTVMFFLSFLPIIYAIYKSFTGVFFGLQGSAWFFGLPAIIYILIYESILFFLPLGCLIYQIIFFTKYIRRYEKLKTTTLILVGLILSSALISIVFAEQSLDLKHTVFRSKFRTHLTALYGEKAASAITFETDSRYEMTYNAHSPVLPADTCFQIRVINRDKIWDDLTGTFTEANKDFYPEFTKHITSKEKLPAEYSYDIRIVSIDFQDYKNGDDLSVLFDRTKYVIKGLIRYSSEINEAIVTNTVNNVWKDIYPNVPLDNDDFNIYFKENDDTDIISVYIRKDKKRNQFIATITDWTKPDLQSKGKFSAIDGKEIILTR